MAFLNDILINARIYQEHLENLEEVLKRLKEAELGLKLYKSQFVWLSVQHLA